MLFRIEIENFYSIRDRQVIDLRVRQSVEDTLGRLSPIYPGSQDRVPNVVAIFGANAAGKSNVLKALTFASWFVARSFELKQGIMLPFQKFGSTERIAKPTRLAFWIAGPVNILDTSGEGGMCPYIYELEIAPRTGAEEDRILLERLSYQPNHSGRPSRILERREDGRIKAAKGFLSARLEKLLEEILRPSVSVISTLARLNHEVALAYVTAMTTVVSNIFLERIEDHESDMTRWYANNPGSLEELQKISRRIDLGIEDIWITNENDPILAIRHSGLDQIMTLPQESHGTRQFFKMFPYIFMTLKRGGIAVVDEIDAAIHPLLLPEILRWFGDTARNRFNAQIWITCHSATLLQDLTKEEVLFCEKDQGGATRIYGLAEIDKVRRDENFLGKYMGGEYGAVPMVG